MDQNVFISGQIKYTEEFLRKANKTFIKRAFIPFIICLIICLLGIVYILTSNANLAFLAIPLFIIVLIVVLMIRFIYVSKQNIKNSLASTPNASIVYNFTLENFFGKIISDTSSFEFNKKYSDVKKIIEDKDCYYIFFDNVVIPILKKEIGEEKQKVLLSLLGKNKQKVEKTHSYYLLIILFIFTILSPFIAVIFITVATQTSPIPEFPNLMFKYAYIFAIMLIFPIVSIITYFIYRRKVRCKKNLIGGIVIAIILAMFSTMSLSNEANIKTDKLYLTKLETTLNIDFPDDCEVNYVITDNKNNFRMMVKFNSSKEILNIVNNYPFVTSLDTSTLNSLPDSLKAYTLTYDYYLTFDLDTNSYNSPIINHGYLLGFNKVNNILDCHSLY